MALDSLMAIGLGIGGLAALGEDQGTGAIALVGAALFTAAALHGSSNADKCRTAFDQYAKETRTNTDGDEIARRPKRRQRVEPQPEEEPVPAPVPVAKPVIPIDDPLASRLPSQPPAPKPAKQAPTQVRMPANDWSQFWREVGQ